MSDPRATIHRIADLVSWKEKGSKVICKPNFDVIPVDFVHRNNAFQAHVFLCHFKGKIDGEAYSFRNATPEGVLTISAPMYPRR